MSHAEVRKGAGHFPPHPWESRQGDIPSETVTRGAGGGILGPSRCEIGLAITYAFWEYPAIRETLDERCSEGAELHARLARACTVGDGRRTSVHEYWLCPEHAELIPVLDDVVRKVGDEPRLLGWEAPTKVGHAGPATT